MNKLKLFIFGGLLCIGQPIFAGDDWDVSTNAQDQFSSWNDQEVAFDSCWSNDVFQRELDSVRNLETSFFVNLAEQGHVPFIGSLPFNKHTALAIMRRSISGRYKQLKVKAMAGNSGHAQNLAEVDALVNKLDHYLWRHTGVLRFVGDHPQFVAFAVVALGAFGIALLCSTPASEPKLSWWQQLRHSFNL